MWGFAAIPKLVLLVSAILALAAQLAVAEKDPDKTTRIAGGRLARQGEVPYIVSLHGANDEDDMFLCGGSIYSKRFIITAAHCPILEGEGGPNAKMRVIAGSLDRVENPSAAANTAQVVLVKKCTIHPKWDRALVRVGGDYVDLAVCELEKDLQFNSAVQPIPIAPAGIVSSGNAKVSGWGLSAKKGSSKSDQLKTIDDVRIVPRQECDKLYREIKRLDIYEHEKTGWAAVSPPVNSTLCAGRVEEAEGACPGDSGGPLQCSRTVGGKPVKYLCGVVSTGYKCAIKLPAGFTDVSKLHDWIIENTSA